MQTYSTNDLVFLGKQVAAGKYVARTTCILAVILSLCVGIGIGSFTTSGGGFASGEIERPLEQGSSTLESVGTNKQMEQNIKQHEAEVLQDPMNPEAWAHLGNLYYDTQQAQKAIDAYNKSLALRPNDVSVIVDCGVMYRELKMFDNALENFTKALTIDPKHETALFNSGVVLYFDLNRKADAKKVWEQLLSINPNAKTPTGAPVSTMIGELAF